MISNLVKLANLTGREVVAPPFMFVWASPFQPAILSDLNLSFPHNSIVETIGCPTCFTRAVASVAAWALCDERTRQKSVFIGNTGAGRLISPEHRAGCPSSQRASHAFQRGIPGRKPISSSAAHDSFGRA